ncbi:hypothetical protein Drorol1_Dr00013845 [Drosera rotundifolia]
MRNLATCYGDHAVRVSDSYCSNPLNLSCVAPKSIPSIPNAVSFTYKTKISAQKHLFITITWSPKLICQGFWVKISDKMPSAFIRNCPSSLQLSKTSGAKRFEACDSEVELLWDLTNARFDSCPVPISSFYIVILIDSNVGLILGDMEDEPMVRKATVGLPIGKFLLVSQCEHFTGNKQQYPTKARFCDSGLAHNIMVRCDVEDEGAKNRILSVLVDNKSVIKIRRLQWNFRGNEVVCIDGVLVDVMWDVHGWFYDQGNAVFMLSTRSGSDNRLWLEDKNNLAEMNHDKVEFSLVICASRNTG